MSPAAGLNFFFLALAALNLLTEAAANTPLLLITEDVQWLDRPSCDVLAFVARRLESDPIMVAAGRTDPDSPLGGAGLPELTLEPLGQEARTACCWTPRPRAGQRGARAGASGGRR